MGANMLGRHWHISQGDVKGGAGQEASGGLLAQDYFALWGEGVSSRTDLQSSALPPRVALTSANAESSLAARAGGRHPMSASQAVEEGLLV